MKSFDLARACLLGLVVVGALGACQERTDTTAGTGSGSTASTQGRDAANTTGGTTSGSGTSSTGSATATGPSATASAASR